MGRRCVAPYPTRPLEHSHCTAKPTRTVRVLCEHILVWSECTGRTRRSGRSVYTGNPTRTVRERYARRIKLSVCTRSIDTVDSHYLELRSVSDIALSSSIRKSKREYSLSFLRNGTSTCMLFLSMYSFIISIMRSSARRNRCP